MLKKTISYTDFDGKEATTDVYFNLTKTECVDLNLEFEDEGGLIGKIKKLVNDTQDGEIPRKPAIDFVKLLIDRSYGVRPKDNPSLFLKEDEDGKPLYKKFKQTAAYDAYLFGLLSGEESLDEFAKSVLPQITDEQKAEAEKYMKEEGLGNLLEG